MCSSKPLMSTYVLTPRNVSYESNVEALLRTNIPANLLLNQILFSMTTIGRQCIILNSIFLISVLRAEVKLRYETVLDTPLALYVVCTTDTPYVNAQWPHREVLVKSSSHNSLRA